MFDAINQFQDAISASGLYPPSDIIPGSIHRFPGTGKRRSNKAGYCRMFEDCQAGYFGDFSQDFYEVWKRKGDTAVSRAERDRINQRLREQNTRNKLEREEKYSKAAQVARQEWMSAEPVKSHAYLETKEVSGYRLRVNSAGDLLIPITDGKHIHSMQYIKPNGDKKFLYGGAITGHFYPIGEKDKPHSLMICEGLATGLSLHRDHGYLTLVAFNAGNMAPVGERIRTALPDANILFYGDNDHAKELNTGLRAVREAVVRCKRKGGGWVGGHIPDFTGLNPGPDDTDYNDLCRLREAQYA